MGCQNWLHLSIAFQVLHLIVQSVVLLLQLAGSGFFEDSGSFCDRVIIHESRLARCTILNIVLKATIICFVDYLSQFAFHSVQLLFELYLALKHKL